MMQDERWRIALTEPNRQKLAIDGLLRIGIPSYLPMCPKYQKVPNGAIPYRLVPMFVGYLFVKFSLDMPGWGRLFSTPGIRNGCGSGLMRNGSKEAYQELTEIEVQDVMLKERQLLGEKDARIKDLGLEIGGQVRIKRGPWAEILANIETLDDDERISLLFKLLGKEHRVVLPLEAIAV